MLVHGPGVHVDTFLHVEDEAGLGVPLAVDLIGEVLHDYRVVLSLKL